MIWGLWGPAREIFENWNAPAYPSRSESHYEYSLLEVFCGPNSCLPTNTSWNEEFWGLYREISENWSAFRAILRVPEQIWGTFWKKIITTFLGKNHAPNRRWLKLKFRVLIEKFSRTILLIPEQIWGTFWLFSCISIFWEKGIAWPMLKWGISGTCSRNFRKLKATINCWEKLRISGAHYEYLFESIFAGNHTSCPPYHPPPTLLPQEVEMGVLGVQPKIFPTYGAKNHYESVWGDMRPIIDICITSIMWRGNQGPLTIRFKTL